MAEPIVTLAVRVTPRADRNALAGVRADGTLLVRTSAAPSDGAANKAVTELLAKVLGVRKSDVELTGGQTAREKRFTVAGLTAETLAERIAAQNLPTE